MNTNTEVLLYNAARSQSLQVIKKSVEQGVICIVDRNYLTTLAIQYYGRGDVPDYETINKIIAFAVNGVEPDLCIVLDAPVQVLKERAHSRGQGERFDNLDEAFLERVRAGYLWEAKQRNLPVVFATEDAEAVANNIWTLVAETLANRDASKALAAISEPVSVGQIIHEKKQATEKASGTGDKEDMVVANASAANSDEPLVEKVDGLFRITPAGKNYLSDAVTSVDGNVYAFTDKLSPITIAAAMARLSRRGDDMRLYLDGGLQFSTRDEYRYTESLVYPVLGDGARSVLVIGGGDGLADRELLRQPGIDKIVHVELDPAVITLARTTMHQANAGALDSPRVDVVIADAMAWLREPHPDVVPAGGFDAVIVDLPDADNPILGRLYSQEFYTLVTRTLAPNGLVVVQSGSPYSTPAAFWRTVSTIQAAGFAVTPYHVDVPTFGDWGFTLGRRGDIAPIPTVPKDAPPLRFLNQPVLNAATVFAGDVAPQRLPPSTLENPRIMNDMRSGYR